MNIVDDMKDLKVTMTSIQATLMTSVGLIQGKMTSIQASFMTSVGLI